MLRFRRLCGELVRARLRLAGQNGSSPPLFSRARTSILSELSLSLSLLLPRCRVSEGIELPNGGICAECGRRGGNQGAVIRAASTFKGGGIPQQKRAPGGDGTLGFGPGTGVEARPGKTLEGCARRGF